MIFTLGHSTHDAQTFIQLCDGVGASKSGIVIDTRSHPGSRKHPQFNREAMEQWVPALSGERFGYAWVPDLGGWSKRSMRYGDEMQAHDVDVLAYANGVFPRQRIGVDRPGYDGAMDERPKAWWNQGLYDYSFWTTTPEFQHACDNIVVHFNKPGQHCILICCEARWDKCHRSMIADYLEHHGVPVFHLKSFVPKRPTTTRFTRHLDAARPDLADRIARYEDVVLESWRGRDG